MDTQASSTKKQTCVYCGNNPTSHGHAWFESLMFVSINPLFQAIFKTRVGRGVLYITEFLLEKIGIVLIYLHILNLDNDYSRFADRAKVLGEDAVRRGWKMEVVTLFGKGLDIYKVTLTNGAYFFFNGLPRIDINQAAGAGWMDDKALLKERLHTANIPVSNGACFSHIKDAEMYFEKHHHEYITKPRFGSRGRHTTTHLSKPEDFKKAFNIAQQLCPFVVVEEHLVGSVYRATIIDGVLEGVLAGDPPRITGDGVHSIEELIAIKNAMKDVRVREVGVTDSLRIFLERQGYILDTILDTGVTIDLSEKIGLSYGGNSREVTPNVHPKLRAELERAAHVIDDPILGFDFITTDVSVDPDTVRWGIIECNALPFINLHHDPLEGTPINVAGKLWDYVEREIQKGK